MAKIDKLFDQFATGAATVLTGKRKNWPKVKQMSRGKNADVWAQVWTKTARPAAIKALKGADLGLTNDEIEGLVDEYGQRRKLPFLKQTTQTDIKRLKVIVRSKGDIEGEIKEAGISKPSRKNLIEFEESEQATRYTLVEANNMLGFTTKKWVAGGAKACEICVAKSGQVVAIGKRYRGGEEIAHAHPGCQCHDEFSGKIDESLRGSPKFGLRKGKPQEEEEIEYKLPKGGKKVTLSEEEIFGTYRYAKKGTYEPQEYLVKSHKKLGIDIYVPINPANPGSVYSYDDIVTGLESIPKTLIKNGGLKKVVVSPFDSPDNAEHTKRYGKDVKVAGSFQHEDRIMRYYPGDPDSIAREGIDTHVLAHELGHGLDSMKDKSKRLSLEKSYETACVKDAAFLREEIRKGGGDVSKFNSESASWASQYSRVTKSRSEDWSDFVADCSVNHDRAVQFFPNRIEFALSKKIGFDMILEEAEELG